MPVFNLWGKKTSQLTTFLCDMVVSSYSETFVPMWFKFMNVKLFAVIKSIAGIQQTKSVKRLSLKWGTCEWWSESFVPALLKHLTCLSILILIPKHCWCEKQGLYVHYGTWHILQPGCGWPKWRRLWERERLLFVICCICCKSSLFNHLVCSKWNIS